MASWRQRVAVDVAGLDPGGNIKKHTYPLVPSGGLRYFVADMAWAIASKPLLSRKPTLGDIAARFNTLTAGLSLGGKTNWKAATANGQYYYGSRQKPDGGWVIIPANEATAYYMLVKDGVPYRQGDPYVLLGLSFYKILA